MLDLRQGDRLVLLGRNGVGKSQLIAMLRLAVAEQVPGVRVGPGVVLGHSAQGMAHLPDGETPHRTIAVRPGLSDGRATSLLAGAGLGVDTHHKPIGRLSPGQKARLGLLALRLAEPNSIFWTSPRTTWTSPARSGSRQNCWRRAPPVSWSRTTAASPGPSGRASC